jgi:hypothetical protein
MNSKKVLTISLWLLIGVALITLIVVTLRIGSDVNRPSSSNSHNTLFFQAHRDEFRDLIALADNLPCNEDTYIECLQRPLPDNVREWSGQNRLFVCHNPDDTIKAIALIASQGGYYTYLPNVTEETPELHACSYGIKCSQKLDDMWFICSISYN